MLNQKSAMNARLAGSTPSPDCLSMQISVVESLSSPSVLVNSLNQIIASSATFNEWLLFGVNSVHSSNNKPLVRHEEILRDVANVCQSNVVAPRVFDVFGETTDERHLELSYHGLVDSNTHSCNCLIHVCDVTERTMENKRLLGSNDELTQLQYHLSHDLVAPIASAKGLLGLLKDDIASGEYGELAELSEETEQQIERLKSLVKDLMSLARAGARTTEVSEFDLRQMVDDIVQSISLHNRVLETSVTLDCDHAVISTDRIRVKQILMNLISNARKFIDKAEDAPEIIVKAEIVDEFIKIRVSDNGLGVDETISSSLFGMFIRGASVYPGHGLGLYIVKKHIDHLNGSVSLLNPLKPTVFEVSIPVSSVRT